jgi:hypothetical protein
VRFMPPPRRCAGRAVSVSMDERVWRLPGPRAFVSDIAAEHGRGRHVATVLPESLTLDPVFTDSLAVAILDEFATQSVSARRVYDAGPGTSVFDAFCQALIFGDDRPATIPDLLRHEEARDVVAVVAAPDLSDVAREELAAFLQRVEVETHATGRGQRLSIVAIMARGQLPAFAGGATSDVTLTSIWWWGRVARWDVAAYIVGLAGHPHRAGVLEDVRTESIVEVARWDLDLAEQLDDQWTGDPDELTVLLGEWCHVPVAAKPGKIESRPRTFYPSQAGLRPPEQMLGSWDSRLVDAWHEQLTMSPRTLVGAPEKLARVVWAAQARVFLPWIEEQRSALYERVVTTLGARRFAEVLNNRFSPPLTADAAIEIGALDRVVRMAIGSSDQELCDVSRQLRKTRNWLSHMRPLSLADQESLVAAGKCLLDNGADSLVTAMCLPSPR